MNRRYHYIVDNNPTTFCCCRWHLATMLANYSALLLPGVLTDTVGLGWASQPNDPRWRLAEREWWTLGAAFGLTEVRYTDSVIGVGRGSRWRAALVMARSLLSRTAGTGGRDPR